MNRPTNGSTEEEVLAYARQWVELAAREGLDAALRLLDPSTEVAWSQGLFEELTFGHFSDGKQPRITDPRMVEGVRVDACRYDDGSGFLVTHDLAMDGQLSDFTAILDFKKGTDGYQVVLDDIHVL